MIHQFLTKPLALEEAFSCLLYTLEVAFLLEIVEEEVVIALARQLFGLKKEGALEEDVKRLQGEIRWLLSI